MQVKQEAVEMASSSGMDIRVTALTATGAAEREQFLHIGQIVVATPGRIAQVQQPLLSSWMCCPKELPQFRGKGIG